MKSSVSAASVGRLLAPRSNLRGRRQDRLDLATSWASGTSGLAATAISSSCPGFLKRRCAVGRSKPASVAPPIVRPELNWTIPETRGPLDRPLGLHADGLADREVLLRRRLLVDDDLVRSGPRPLDSVSGLNTESPLAMEKPRFGAPPKTTAFPSSPMNWVASESTLPSACATPESARTFGSSDSSSCRCGDSGLIPDVEGRLPGDDRVRALADVGEDPVERLVDRVGQDVRTADHRDPEDDRDRGQRGTELPAQEATDGKTAHAARLPVHAQGYS